jgi:maltooligosyltrehalose trehalohydrolase
VHEVNPRALVIAESGLNDPRVIRGRGSGGWACDAAWADDFHHALRVPLTGYREGYYAEFGRIADLAKALDRPHVHDGAYSTVRRRRFGAPADDVPPQRFVVFDQNHDQVGNRAYGDRLPAPARPLAAFCTLLSPFVPMLFMGEEYGEDAPFLFFCDHIDPEIAQATREGRRREFASFAEFGRELPDPQDPATFAASKLTRRADLPLAGLYRELLAVRRELPAGEAAAIEFDEHARWLRFRPREGGRYEAICNFSRETPVTLPCDAGLLRLATHPGVGLVGGGVELPPLSGALVA